MKTEVITLDAEAAGEIELDETVFGLAARTDLLHRYVTWQLARRRSGNHRVKTVSEINATTKKMYRQKGTGRARHGSKKVSQFRGGAKVMGPVVRDHSHDLPKKVRRLALKTALSVKAAEGKLRVLDAAALPEGKTGLLAKKLAKLGWSSVLIVDGAAVEQGLERAARNLVGVDCLPQIGANVYDILRRDTLVLTKDAVAQLEARLK